MRRFLPEPQVLRQDFTASIVVFLVAVPLCVGIAVASGVPAEVGLITGIVGGLVAGAMPGSSIQVSGPAAGMTVLVYDAVTDHGVGTLGLIVLLAGAIQIVLGLVGLGRWFRAISAAVVQGMLAGIGLVIIFGQGYSLFDQDSPGGVPAALLGLPRLLVNVATDPASLAAGLLGLGTVAVLFVWPQMPARFRVVPGALVAVVLCALVAAVLPWRVERVEIQGLLGSINLLGPSELGRATELSVLSTALVIALIASAESLFSAAAVDRMHEGPRTRYNQELVAQGAGNAICGLLGALPMTAVIVRSATNVHAGARTKASRVLHGFWLLLFAAFFPVVLAAIPVAALAGVLVHAGWKLLALRDWRRLWRTDRGEAVVLTVTAVGIATTNLLEGVLIGLLLAVAKTAWDVSHVHVHVGDGGAGEPLRVRLTGNATFLRLPRLLESLEALPADRPVELDLSEVRHLDHACRVALNAWTAAHNQRGETVNVSPPGVLV